MAKLLHRLIYASRVTPGVADDLEAQVSDILRASIRNNRAVNVTGLLLAHQGWFLQALEGSEVAVSETYDRILADPRHCDTVVLVRHDAETRAFPRWSMSGRMISDEDAAMLKIVDRRGAFDPTAPHALDPFVLLTAMAETHDQILTRQQARFMDERLSA